MRPAVNFSNKYQWKHSNNEGTNAYREFKKAIHDDKIKKDINEFSKKESIKWIDPNEKTIKHIAKLTHQGIKSIIDREFPKASMMADDILQFFQMQVSNLPDEGKLRNILLPLKNKILNSDNELRNIMAARQTIKEWEQYAEKLKKAA
jgi:hypothetical protein